MTAVEQRQTEIVVRGLKPQDVEAVVANAFLEVMADVTIAHLLLGKGGVDSRYALDATAAQVYHLVAHESDQR